MIKCEYSEIKIIFIEYEYLVNKKLLYNLFLR